MKLSIVLDDVENRYPHTRSRISSRETTWLRRSTRSFINMHSFSVKRIVRSPVVAS